VSNVPRSHSIERIPVAILEHHVHLTQGIIEQLFCDRYKLHQHAQFSQPHQYVAEESVTLVGPRARLSNVRVIGPPRADNQIEVSQTDAVALGIQAPLRESGDLKDSPGILIEGPRACVRLDYGVIRMLQHVHMSAADADHCGLKDQDRVDVMTPGVESRILFCDVTVRVSPEYRLELHLDADEATAAGLHPGAFVAISNKT
jgi:propanediol utilization protein